MKSISTLLRDGLAFLFQVLHFKKGHQQLKEPLIRKMRFKASSFYKSKQEAPMIGEEAYLFQLDAQLKPLNPQVLASSMTSSNTPDLGENQFFREKTPQKPKPEIDLHAETLLGEQFDKTPKDKLLEKQLDAFEVALDNAILTNMDEITFIHGVGNGVLKSEIHKRLSKHDGVKFYQDAKKQKFGYGATAVTFK